MAVHRIIEAHAARFGDSPAISDRQVTLSYRELNQRANAVARYLIGTGFRRGAVATVCLPRSPQTAIVLLGILKAGGTYVFIDPDADDQWPRGVSFGTQTVDVTPALQQPTRSSANLPIVARQTDVACVLPDRSGAPAILVPHATIMSLRQREVPPRAEWSGDAGALDLWAGLMNGATVTLNGAEFRSAA